jgi:hypothetical protein
VTLDILLSRSDRLAAPADDMTRQICSFCTAEPGTTEGPATAQIRRECARFGLANSSTIRS